MSSVGSQSCRVRDEKERARIEAKENQRLKQVEKLQQIETFGLALDITFFF